MTDLGLWFTLYIVSTILSYLSWQLSDIPKIIEKIRDNVNILAIFLPFPMYWALVVDYIPHGIHYVAFMKGYVLIGHTCSNIREFYLFLPLVFFIFLFPKFRKNWKTSLIISILAIPVINFYFFTNWIFALPADFGRDKVEIDEALHLKIFAQRFNQCLDVFSLLLLLILRIEQPTGEKEKLDFSVNTNLED
jgi:hypothetical protein